VTAAECRSLQDGLYQSCTDEPGVPSWFYTLQRGNDQAIIHATIDKWRAAANSGTTG
jgi:hypothetical protein